MNLKCITCGSNYNVKEADIYTTKCGHFASHKNCIISWLENNNNSCPFCSEICDPAEILPAFVTPHEEVQINNEDNFASALDSKFELFTNEITQNQEKMIEEMTKVFGDLSTQIQTNSYNITEENNKLKSQIDSLSTQIKNLQTENEVLKDNLNTEKLACGIIGFEMGNLNLEMENKDKNIKDLQQENDSLKFSNLRPNMEVEHNDLRFLNERISLLVDSIYMLKIRQQSMVLGTKPVEQKNSDNEKPFEEKVKDLKDSIRNLECSEHTEQKILDMQEELVKRSNALTKKREKIATIRQILRANKKSDDEIRSVNIEIGSLRNLESINKLKKELQDLTEPK